MTKLEKQILAQEQMNILAKTKTKRKRRKGKISYKDIPLNSDFNHLIKKDISQFKAKSHNREKAILEFIQFAYFEYSAPLWLLNIIKKNQVLRNSYQGNPSLIDRSYSFHLEVNTPIYPIFEAISNNKSLKQILPFSKKMIHMILNSKKDEFHSAVIEAYLIEENVNKFLSNIILEIFPSYIRLDERFKYRFRFVHQNENLLHRQSLTELFDYFNNSEEAFNNYKTFYKRSFDRILAESNEWHIQQTKKRTGKNLFWDKKYNDFIYEKNDFESYSIKELLNSNQLAREGSEMGHCVGSYSRRCVDGATSIVSFKKVNDKSKKYRLTIEINNKNKTIVQIQGLYNSRGANSSELYILEQFAKANNLTISRYLY